MKGAGQVPWVGLLVLSRLVALTSGYFVGVGSADMTGPAADVNLMGYAMPAQTAGGIHFRLRARAFIFGEDEAGADWDSGDIERLVFVSIDSCMGTQAITSEVASRLQESFPGMYPIERISISGTHTHSAPAGFLQNVLFQVPSLGFVHETFEGFVTGIVRAIERAHKNGKSGRRMNVAVGEMEPGFVNINRSPSGYVNNPKEERDFYGHNTDLNMTVLRIDEADGTPVGMVNWFAVHGTSMPNSNLLVSGDNKGYASQLFETWYNGPDVPTGKGSFVSAFASTNLGDVSPNINGTFCSDTGKPCEELHSTCDGKNEKCHGRGPSQDPFESTAIIGTRQAEFADKLFKSQTAQVKDGIAYVQAYRDMSNMDVKLPNGTTVTTCKPALGYSFAAGTTDGPGAFDFVQSQKSTNPFWELLRNLVSKPSHEMKACQHPKPVLLPTGEVNRPYPWHPTVMPMSIFLLGNQLAIISVPAEFTTMAGRRLRNAVRKVLVDGGKMDAVTGAVVIAGLASEYSSYVTTYEEYLVQRYEAASTLYGPYTHAAYVQELVALAESLVKGNDVDPGPTPANLMDKQISLLPNTLADSAPEPFGSVKDDVQSTYDLSMNPVISVTFWSANPRNKQHLETSFLRVEYKRKDGKWGEVSTDSDFDSRFIFKRESLLKLHCTATIEWRPSQSLRDVKPGTYRIWHVGDSKNIFGKISSFSGVSSEFTLTNSNLPGHLEEDVM